MHRYLNVKFSCSDLLVKLDYYRMVVTQDLYSCELRALSCFICNTIALQISHEVNKMSITISYQNWSSLTAKTLQSSIVKRSINPESKMASISETFSAPTIISLVTVAKKVFEALDFFESKLLRLVSGNVSSRPTLLNFCIWLKWPTFTNLSVISVCIYVSMKFSNRYFLCLNIGLWRVFLYILYEEHGSRYETDYPVFCLLLSSHRWQTQATVIACFLAINVQSDTAKQTKNMIIR